MSIPYTYFLYHKPTGIKYYGVSYRKGCSPENLWKTYFTSSSIIHNLIEEYGKDTFEYEVRKTFSCGNKALEWEARVLQKMNVTLKEDWANQHIPGCKFRSPKKHKEETKVRIGKKIKGIKRSHETKRKLSESAKRREKQKRENGWKMPLDSIAKQIETRNKRIENGEINPYSKERNKKMADSKRGKKRKYLPNGSYIMVDPSEL